MRGMITCCCVRVWFHEAEDGTQTHRKYKVGKGQRLIVVGAVTEHGFLPGKGGNYTFRGKKDKSSAQPADYHHEVCRAGPPTLTHTTRRAAHIRHVRKYFNFRVHAHTQHHRV